MVWDNLDGASDAEIQALLRDLAAFDRDQEYRDAQRTAKLELDEKSVIKPRFRGSVMRTKRVPARCQDRLLNTEPIRSLNDPVRVTIDLPAYLVAGMSNEPESNDELIRVALRDLFEKRGKTWWYPRLRAVVAARSLVR